MHALTTKLCRHFFTSLLAHQYESRIPRSGEEGKQVNCPMVSVDKAGEPYLIVQELHGDDLKCIEWNRPKMIPTGDAK